MVPSNLAKQGQESPVKNLTIIIICVARHSITEGDEVFHTSELRSVVHRAQSIVKICLNKYY